MPKIGIRKVKIYYDRDGKTCILPPKGDDLNDLSNLNAMDQLDLREALQAGLYLDQCEVWLYPYECQDNKPLLLLTKKNSHEKIYEATGSLLKASCTLIDIDDLKAHEQIKPSNEAFFNEIEACLEPLKALDGFLYYRTLRGARVGFIYENAQDIDEHYFVKRELFFQVEDLLKGLNHVEVDKACLDQSRSFTAPHSFKRIKGLSDIKEITKEHARLYIHDKSLSDDHFNEIMEMYHARQQKEQERQGVEPHDSSPSNSKKGVNRESTTKAKKRKGVFCPASIDHLENKEQYELSRALIYKISSFVHLESLREDILRAINHNLMNDRRDDSWIQREIEGLALNIPSEAGDAIIEGAPPEPIQTEFKELLPIRRVFERGDDLELAKAILDTFGDNPYPLWHGDGLRRYDSKEGIWKFYGRHALKRIAMSSEGAIIEGSRDASFKVNNTKIKASIELINSIAGADSNETMFDTAPRGIVLHNTFVSADKNGLILRDISPAFYAIHKLNIDIPKADQDYFKSNGQQGSILHKRPSVFIDTYLKKSLTRELEEDETSNDLEDEIQAKITCILEWLGLALLGLCTREAISLIVHGKGSNGKSVLTQIITELFGGDQVCHLPPQKMGERFSRAQLFGALVNVVSEMPENEIIASDTIKAVISGDKIEVEKKHKDPFAFVPRAGHVFSCNNLPPSKDRSHGLWRRFLPIKFEHVFTAEDRDRYLIDKLRQEYDSIVIYALDYAMKYIKRGGFQYQDYINQWRWGWRESTDQIASFYRDACDLVHKRADYTATDEVYEQFKTWSEENNASRNMSKIKFSKAFNSLPQMVCFVWLS